jgi:DNA primase
MAFPERFLDELIARSDIVDVVSGYVALTKRSGSNLFGLCPFHNEKTPSFSVSPDKQIYHCFGCGKGGGVINFIMEIENLSYPDAVRFLARRANLDVPEDQEYDGSRGRRSRMLELNRDAARLFYENLSKPEGRAAVDYINRRGISAAMVRRFGLGVAPDGWSHLVDAMTQKGYTAYELVDAGLAKKNKRGGLYDTFRNRLMFPVIDIRGSVIGFSGRILGDGEPKYLNSPDTLVFNKSRNLFALNLAKRTKQGMLILAEGNIDVVSLHQAGFDCAVASLGTSLTPEQARLMARYTENVVISYDADEAGVKAAKRAIGILESTGLHVKVLHVTGAKDPDEYIQKNGADAFRILLNQSENSIDYQILSIKRKYDLTNDEQRVTFLKEVTQMLSRLPNAVEREIYGGRVAAMAGVSAQAVASEVNRAFKRRMAEERKKRERNETRPAITAQPREHSIRYDDVYSATAEEGIIRLLLSDPTLMPDDSQLNAGDFTSPFLGKIFTLIQSRAAAGRQTTIPSLAGELEPEEISRLTEISQKPISMGNAGQAMGDYIEKIKMQRLKKEMPDDLAAAAELIRRKKGYGG